MTALDNTSLPSTTAPPSTNNSTIKPAPGVSRLSLRGQKRTLSSDISPAPEPRSSHRIRTNSSSDLQAENVKTGVGSRAKASSTPSGAPTYRAAQLGLRRHPTPSNPSPTPTNSGGVDGGSGGVGGVAGGRVPGVCPLANLGNTCFLNSVLYALRFLPGFTHDLHHLHTHLQAARCEGDESVQQRIQFLSELHSVFVELGREERGASDARRLPALQPYPFLQALRVVNPMFEGNRQQDAHELVHCLLDQLCHLPQDLVKKGTTTTAAPSPASPQQDVSMSPPHKKARRRSERIQAQEEDHNKAVDVVGSKFVGRMCLETCCSECEKVTGREETFLEVCVPVKTKADFDDEEPPSEGEVFMSALCEEECLQGNNKYWCDACSHHNEARRSVHYPQLPHHLLIHVKRFSAYSRNMYTSKCSDAMPAPLQLSCFCRSCIGVRLLQRQQTIDSCSNLAHKPASNTTNNLNRGKNAQSSRSSFSSNRNGNNINSGGELQLQNGDVVCSDAATHLPYHLSAMVCHLGASLSSGHYMTYVRVSAQLSSNCPDQSLGCNNSSSGGSCCNTSLSTTQSSLLSASDDGNQHHTNSCDMRHHSAHATGADNTATANAANALPSTANGSAECNWLECCALRLDQVLPQVTAASLANGYNADIDSKSTTNSKSSSKQSNSSESKSRGGSKNAGKHSSKNNNSSSSSTTPQQQSGLWLECDDEKIKLVSAVEVVERMRGTLITPYLLFYSRLPQQSTS